MGTIPQLLDAIRREGRRAEFPIDRPVYEKAGRDSTVPILYAGTLEAPVCVFARDLGKDEVAAGEPLIGAGGRLVRSGIVEARTGTAPPKSDRRIDAALGYVLLTNTMPYKPPGNKAYSTAVKERFRPFLAELLVRHWQGTRVLTLGTEAFQWFAPYADPDAFDAFWRRDDRYEAELGCVVRTADGAAEKAVTLAPLPHPSPLNQRWYKRFPELLARRLAT